ncbi:MAG: metallophosphoesterase [Pseudomonadota bacterium]
MSQNPNVPGRQCPLAYRTQACRLATLEPLKAETFYVVGGLYGNRSALAAILRLRRREARAGLPLPRLVFNGDFHWFDADPNAFARLQRVVDRHDAVLGNVEMELLDPQPGAGCGCAYPDFVDDATVQRSNAIIERLRTAARQADRRHGSLQNLHTRPKMLRLKVDSASIGIVHGDPDSLAGWGLAIERMPPSGQTHPELDHWFHETQVDILACTHTCTAYLQSLVAADRPRAVINNGAAGMPNFRDDPRGVITRISRHPSPDARLYGTRIGGIHCDALGVEWSRSRWLEAFFDRIWAADSPASRSYRERILCGPDHDLERACRA